MLDSSGVFRGGGLIFSFLNYSSSVSEVRFNPYYILFLTVSKVKAQQLRYRNSLQICRTFIMIFFLEPGMLSLESSFLKHHKTCLSLQPLCHPSQRSVCFKFMKLFVLYRIDTTRVEFTIPLRENWALPFFAIQIAAITYLLRTHLQPAQEVSIS